MFEYEFTMGNSELSDIELKRLLQLEAQFLPTKKTLIAFLKRAKPISGLSSLEAYIELHYLTKICLHHRNWYYKLSDIQIEDALYDQLERRAKQILEETPQYNTPNHPINQVGY